MAAISTPAPATKAFRFPGQRKLEHSLFVYRRIWRGTFFGTLVSPVLFLTAIGEARDRGAVPTSYGSRPWPTAAGGVPGGRSSPASHQTCLESWGHCERTVLRDHERFVTDR